MKNIEDISSQPHRLERNRAILLSRDLLNVKDWVILSCKTSEMSGESLPGDAAELCSFAALGPGGRELLDVLVRPDGAVSSEQLKIHGCDSAHVFDAPEFANVHKILKAGFARTRVICWNPSVMKATLLKLCRQFQLSELQANFVDLQTHYSSFVGEPATEDGYRQQSLPSQINADCPGVAPLCECRGLFDLLQEMAGSSQSSESVSFNKNWSAAFYRPKLAAAQKLKEMLGLND
jgi:hypothetical protein